MAEGRRRHLVGTIRGGRADDRAEVAIVGRALAAVGLLRGVVHQNEPVVWAERQCAGGIVEVGLAVAARPVVLEIRADAVLGVVEGEDGAAVVIHIRVAAGVVAGGIPRAAEPVDAGVIARGAFSAAAVIRRAAGGGEHAAVVVERMVLLQIG